MSYWNLSENYWWWSVKGTPPNMVYGLKLYSKNSYWCLHVVSWWDSLLSTRTCSKSSAVILGLQFIYTSMCMQTRFGMYIADIHPCLCKLLYTCLVHTWALRKRATTSLILYTHTSLYMSEMKNESCWVHPAYMFSQILIEL